MSTTTIHLPKTSSHSAGQHTHIKLLARVKEWAPHGLGFEHSRLFRCGARVRLDELPRPTVLLEYAGSESIGRRCVGRAARIVRRHLVVLWRFDFEFMYWHELARAYTDGESYEWAAALMPIAALALRGGLPAPPIEASAIARRIVTTLDYELDGVPPEIRPAVLGALVPEIHGRVAAYVE